MGVTPFLKKLWRKSRAGSDPTRDETVEKSDKPHFSGESSWVRLNCVWGYGKYFDNSAELGVKWGGFGTV